MWVKLGIEESTVAETDISDNCAVSGILLCVVDRCSVHTIGFCPYLHCDGEPGIQTQGQFVTYISNAIYMCTMTWLL